MRPFVLRQHEKDRAAVRVLQAAELEKVGGGRCHSNDDATKEETITTTPSGSSNDGCDEN